MTIYSLYKKTHNVTGLMYLGQTARDPFKYKGSGLHWVRHINKHGNNVTTEIISQFTCKNLLKEAGRKYSKLWNVVESKDWANIVEESGSGGFNGLSKEGREKIRIAACKPKSTEHKRKIALSVAKSCTGIKRGPYKKKPEHLLKHKRRYTPVYSVKLVDG